MIEFETRRAIPASLIFAIAFFWSSAFAAPDLEFETEPEEDLTMVEEYLQTMNLVDGLGIYNKQLGELLEDQQRDIAQIRDSLGRIKMTRRQLGPLTERMVLALERFIELDLPFRLEERRAVVAELKDLMDRVDVSAAERFRRVMDAYQTEIDYGTSREAYSDFIEINGRGRQVDVLRMGRTVLAFQTTDRAVTGVWDERTGEWRILGDEYAKGVRDALRMARNTITNDLTPLPIPAPGAGQ
ncbi:MAG: DUF3450 domain-containing protein [Gammaproteobacteria bacterium]|nr:DUF3450 domain-containing protein [Gammaproteobacteria bacterium]